MTADTDLSLLRRDVQYLLDRTAILDCVARHARGCDRHDVDLISSAYHGDGVDDVGIARATELAAVGLDGVLVAAPQQVEVRRGVVGGDLLNEVVDGGEGLRGGRVRGGRVVQGGEIQRNPAPENGQRRHGPCRAPIDQAPARC